jgi:hypothetical protein
MRAELSRKDLFVEGQGAEEPPRISFRRIDPFNLWVSEAVLRAGSVAVAGSSVMKMAQWLAFQICQRLCFRQNISRRTCSLHQAIRCMRCLILCRELHHIILITVIRPYFLRFALIHCRTA